MDDGKLKRSYEPIGTLLQGEMRELLREQALWVGTNHYVLKPGFVIAGTMPKPKYAEM